MNQNTQLTEVTSIEAFAARLAAGDLSVECKEKGPLADSLRDLQARLRSIAGRMVAASFTGAPNYAAASGAISPTDQLSSALQRLLDRMQAESDALQISQSRYQSLLIASPDDITITDMDGVMRVASSSALRVFGYNSEDEVIGIDISDLAWTDDKEKVLIPFRNLLAGGEYGTQEYRARRKDGKLIDVEVRAERILGADGKPESLLFVIRDITERNAMIQAERDQRALAEALRDTAAALNSALSLEDVFDTILENIDRVVPHDTADILLLEEDGTARIVRSKGFEHIVPEVVSEFNNFRLPVDEIPNWQRMRATGKPCLINLIDETNWVPNESTGWARSYLGTPILVKGRMVGVLGLLSRESNFFTEEHAKRLVIFADQTAVAFEKARLFEQLTYLAATDSLTGIRNRRQFFLDAEREIARAHRFGSPVSVVMLDIDHFKEVNDTYGHHIGDAVLRRVASLISTTVRKIDVVGRYGGEEFALVLPEVGAELARTAAERVRESIASQPILLQPSPVQITVSIGVAECVAGGCEISALLQQADAALYQAKQKGRNRVEIHPLVACDK